jgi:peroxiredoxin Q/BCP
VAVGVGDQAPDFSLPSTGGGEVRLSDLRPAPVVLVFYPGDATPVCTLQLNTYNDDIQGFDDLGAVLLAISPQGIDSHEAFSAANRFSFPLLADTEKQVGEAYGVLGPLGFYRRSVFVLDGEGVIRYAHRSMAGLTFKPSTELLEAVRSAS